MGELIMNAIQKEYAVKELKNEIKENLKRKFYKFFFVIKALVTLLLFILFEYLIIAHKMPLKLNAKIVSDAIANNVQFLHLV